METPLRGEASDLEHPNASTTYITSSVDLAAYLAVNGLNPHRVEPPPPNAFPKYSSFLFERTPQLEALVEEWASSRTLTLDLRRYVAVRRDLFQAARSAAGGGR
jgi:hypothetical protein